MSEMKTIKVGARQVALLKRWVEKSAPAQSLRIDGDAWKGGTLTFGAADGAALAACLRLWLDGLKYHGDRATMEGLAARLAQ